MRKDVTKKQTKDGEVVYSTPGGKIRTYTETFYDAFHLGCTNLESLFDLMIDANEEDGTAYIGKSLLENLDRNLEDMADFITDHFGHIEVVRACKLRIMEKGKHIKEDEILDVIFKPRNEKAPETEPSRKDSPGA